MSYHDDIYEYRKKLEQQMSEIPLWEKECLTIEEAAGYSGIGINKIRTLANAKKCPFVIQMGKQLFIVRKKFDAFIEKQTHI